MAEHQPASSAPDTPPESADGSVDAAALVARLCAPGKSFRKERRRLSSLAPEQVVPALAHALASADNARVFYRVASTLAMIGTDEAVEALARHARTRRRFPRLAVNALAESRNRAAVPPLLELLSRGHIEQRRAAAFGLARTGTAFAIEPLAEKAASDVPPVYRTASPQANDASAPKRDPIRDEAWRALRRMGRTRGLAHKILIEAGMPVAQKASAICALADAVNAFTMLSIFDPQRFLDREAQSVRSAVRQEARQAAEFLRTRNTLLRPASDSAAGTLLRAASDPGSGDSDLLLRGASAPEESSQTNSVQAMQLASWWNRLRAWLRR